MFVVGNPHTGEKFLPSFSKVSAVLHLQHLWRGQETSQISPAKKPQDFSLDLSTNWGVLDGRPLKPQ